MAENINDITSDIFACACYHPYEWGGDRSEEPTAMALIHTDGAVDHITGFTLDPLEKVWIQGLGSIVQHGGQQALWNYAKYCTGEYIILPLTNTEAVSLLTYGRVC